MGPSKVIDEIGISPKVMNGAPESLRQVLQWQWVKLRGRIVLVYVISPHRQPPFRTGSVFWDIFKTFNLSAAGGCEASQILATVIWENK